VSGRVELDVLVYRIKSLAYCRKSNGGDIRELNV